MQYESDNLCKEYGLSVLPKKYDYSKYATNNLYKEFPIAVVNKCPTWNGFAILGEEYSTHTVFPSPIFDFP